MTTMSMAEKTSREVPVICRKVFSFLSSSIEARLMENLQARPQFS